MNNQEIASSALRITRAAQAGVRRNDIRSRAQALANKIIKRVPDPAVREQLREHIVRGTLKLVEAVRHDADDADLQLGASLLAEGITEQITRNPHALAMGRMRSKKKAAAARQNGKKGGRPRTHNKS